MEFRVGVMVVGAVLTATVLALMFGVSPFAKTYTINVKFAAAPGVSIGTPVRKSGIRIGEVTKIELTPDNHVLAVLQIDGKYRIYDNETCSVRSSLLGDTWLDFEPTQAKPADSGMKEPNDIKETTNRESHSSSRRIRWRERA